ncbi:MAG: hypothetical protein VX346_07740 [Planctomycetota bacterium]|nr:hypothetical protein [Planctomycetota bacterium]
MNPLTTASQFAHYILPEAHLDVELTRSRERPMPADPDPRQASGKMVRRLWIGDV